MMRFNKIILITLILSSVSMLSLSCASGSTSTSEGQAVAVQRGDLRVDITGVGNLALSQKIDLAFEMDGTVSEVLTEEAATVEEGQVLARLDTSDWEELIVTLEDKVITAERNVTAKERAVTTAERKVTDAERKVTDTERTVTTAERKVTDAERNVTVRERAVTTAERQVTARRLDLLQAQVNLNNANLALEQTEETSTDRLEIEVKELQVEIARGRVEDAQRALEDATTVGIEDAHKAVEDARIAVEDARQGVEDAKVRLEDAKIAVEDAGKGVEDARIAVKDGRKALADAQEALAEAKTASPQVTAPFTGFIIKVNVKGGDVVKKGTVAAVIADPDKFEADIQVNEMDYLKVKLGGEATVQVDAVPGLSLPAKIAQIAPTATIQSGVVNYKVKVAVQSLEAAMLEQQPASGSLFSDNTSSGAPAGRFGPMFGSGNLTQEQIDQIRQQRQAGPMFGSGNLTQEQIDQMRQRWQQAPAGQQQPTSAASEDFRLAEGLTVTVSIIVAERNNVLLVPNTAIMTRQGQTYVKIVTPGGTTEERTVMTGISNWQYTEVTAGLTEGEQVVVPQGTATSTSSQQQRMPGGGGLPGFQRILQ